MKGGGGNVTESHAEEISLSALFLLEAAKRADSENSVLTGHHHTQLGMLRKILTL